MSEAPLDRLDALLAPGVRDVVDRETPIPSIALRAQAIQSRRPELVRADIGQISGLDPQLEVLYGPPVGLPGLRDLIAETWTRALGLDGTSSAVGPLEAANVAVCTGAAEGLSLLFRCFAADRTVGLPRGHWENYGNGVSLAGGRTVIVDFFDREGGLDLAGLARSIREHRIDVLVANFPCNPTGAVLTLDESAALANLLVETGTLAIADEVYARLRFDDVPPHSLLGFAPGHVIAVSSASKELLLPGARVGYVVSAHSELTDRVLRKVIRANTASPNVLGQKRAADLLEADLVALRAGRPAPTIRRVVEAMRGRRDRLLDVLARHGMAPMGRPNHRPEGTIFLMAELPPWWAGDDTEFARDALEAAVVSTVPGSAFGLPGAVRFSFGGMTPDAITRLDSNLERFRRTLG